MKEEWLRTLAERQRQQALACASYLELISRNLQLDRLADYWRSHQEATASSLERHLSARKLILSLAAHTPRFPPNVVAPDIPSLLLNVAVCFTLLEYTLDDTQPDRAKCRVLLGEAIDTLAARWAKAISHQVDRLAILLRVVIDFIERLALGESRIVLLEFPIGNSIPTRLLAELLQERGQAPHILRVALSRNDSRKAGVTRAELMDERLSTWGLTSNDLVVYVDEWLSGSNFNNLALRLDRIVKQKGAFLLPIAAVAPGAEAKDHYRSYCAEHDAIARKIGMSGSDLRIPFPPLQEGGIDTEQRFFWSESDRLAGYRKMQHLGSLLGSIFEVVEEIRTNSELLLAVHGRFMQAVAEEGNPNDEEFNAMFERPDSFRSALEAAYPDFCLWKEDVQKMDFESNKGVAEDPSGALQDLTVVLVGTAEGRKAKLLVDVAAMWIRSTEIDPRNQYYFRGHVPVIAELPEELQGLARTFYRYLAPAIRDRLSI